MEERYVTVYLPGPMLAEIKVGEAAYVYVDGVPDRPFEGTIAFISDEAEFTPKNVQTKEQRVKLVYAVRIDVANRENILKPGMPADIILGEK
jgi:HlyD family secretion protein